MGIAALYLNIYSCAASPCVRSLRGYLLGRQGLRVGAAAHGRSRVCMVPLYQTTYTLSLRLQCRR